MSLLYFAYGSNMHPGRLRARVSSATPMGVAYLPNHRLMFDKRGADGSGKGNIVPTHRAEVWGVVYRLTTEHAEVLDGIEGDGYMRVTVDLLRSPSGERFSAFSYRAHAQARMDGLQPYSWYLEFLLLGAAHHGLPVHYIEQLQEVAVTVDSDVARARREQALLDFSL